MKLQLSILSGAFSEFTVGDVRELHEDIQQGELFSLTYSPGELSVVAETQYAPVSSGPDWKFFKYSGSLDDEVTGVVAVIAKPLADRGISVFVINTYGFGYFGVMKKDLDSATRALEASGITIAS